MNSKGHFSFTIGEVIAVLGILIVLVLGGIVAKALKYFFGYFPKWETIDLMLIIAPSLLIILLTADNILKSMGY